MHIISRDSPCYYLTSVTKDRLPVFRTNEINRLLLTENMLMQRVHYTYQNPVRAGLVKNFEEYRWSSIRCWNGRLMDDEPLLMDIGQIRWRRGEAS